MFRLKSVVRVFVWLTAGMVSFVLLYILGAILLSVLPVNSDFNEPEKDVTIYLLSNGVHTDIVMPVSNQNHHWLETIRYSHTPAGDSTHGWIGFGWGDKGFYLHTPTWADLTFSTAFRAAFNLGGSAMHVTFQHEPEVSSMCRRIRVPSATYSRLVIMVHKSFENDATGKPIQIRGYSYGGSDAFYEAKGSYSLFKTCNTWTNNLLKDAGLPAAVWTPLDKGILRHYPEG